MYRNTQAVKTPTAKSSESDRSGAGKHTLHNGTISIAKALCILLMVIGHSGCPERLYDAIYMFHMPCFFFISGFLLKGNYLTSIGKGIIKRGKSIWWPFVKWTCIFILLHNLLYRLNINPSRYLWSEMDIGGMARQVLLLRATEDLLGGFWFLKELLLASVISAIVLRVTRRIVKERIAPLFGIAAAFVVMAVVLSVLPYNSPDIRSQTMLATAFYLSGYAYGKVPRGEGRWLVAAGGLAIVILVSLFFEGNMFVSGWRIPLYYAVALIGTLAVLNFSSLIRRGPAAAALDYIGSRTFYILTFHFLAFKLVSYLKIAQYGLPRTALSEMPVISVHNDYYWLAYSIVGVVVPLLIREADKYMQNRIRTCKLRTI